MNALYETMKFSLLIDKLSDTEFNEFTALFVKQCGRKALMTPFISQTFINKCNTNHSNDHCKKKAMKIVQTIIRSSSNDIEPMQESTIQTLPKTIIGEISSYLPQKDYVSLSTTSKLIYIGCNDPNKLQNLDLIKIDNYSAIQLQHYGKLKHLGVRLQQFDQISLPKNQCILNGLSSITFDGNGATNAITSSLFFQNALCWTNIKTLQLKSFGGVNGFQADIFLGLLSLFTGVDNFEMRHCVITQFELSQQIQYQSFCSKL